MERLKRERAIQEIESSSFNQAAFSSSASEKLSQISLPGERGETGDGFTFGTAAEKASRDDFLEKINNDGLCHPNLFGDEKEREEKWIRKLSALRQKLIK